MIIGGGPGGTAAAITLARAGNPVTLIERSVDASDKVCGDFLSTEALAMIEGLGVDLSAASTISAVRL
ncbi:MAG: FAD-dependent monooxygenase, partial [Acetobacteraceae bacterium]